MTIQAEALLTWASLLVSIVAVVYAVLVNRATTSTLRDLQQVARSVDVRTTDFLRQVIEANPTIVAAGAKREFMKFLMDNPDMIKSLTIRPGGLVILSSVFEARFSESEFNRHVAELFKMSGDLDRDGVPGTAPNEDPDSKHV